MEEVAPCPLLTYAIRLVKNKHHVLSRWVLLVLRGTSTHELPGVPPASHASWCLVSPPAAFSQKLSSEWKPEIRLPSGSDHVMLKSLDWNAEYEVFVVAENQQGKSKAARFVFRTSAQPTAIPGMSASASCEFPALN